MLIVRSGKYEQGLVDDSSLSEKPREVAQIKIVATGDTEILGKRYYGDHDQVIVPLESINSLIRQVSLNGSPKELHFNHTHPHFEFTFDRNTQVLSPLSPADRRLGRDLSLRYNNLVVVMRASTPAGVTYETYFLNGDEYPLGRYDLPKNR